MQALSFAVCADIKILTQKICLLEGGLAHVIKHIMTEMSMLP